jgi:membrane associated rhomboid family serine protease
MDDRGQQYYYYRPRPVFGFPKLTPAVKAIQLVFARSGLMERYFAFWPQAFLQGRYVWQIVTSIFLHAGLWHLALNMLPLTIFGFGPSLERQIGAKRFCAVYFMCGIGGNLLFLAANLHGLVPVLGASGAVCGILAAYAMAFPERFVLVFFVYPMKVKWVVLVFFGIEVLSAMSMHGASNIAHSAHIGGFVFGWAYMKIVYKLSLPFAFVERTKWQVRRLFGGLSSLRNPFRRSPGHRKYRPLDDESFIDEEIDPILDKISKNGIHSLTAHERRVLKRARQRMGRG